ncbi:MAG: hypothetical protein Q9216_005695 [Gyalolechia sp. 2 TL-2023]
MQRYLLDGKPLIAKRRTPDVAITTKADTQPFIAPFSFLKLPSEIRVMIYEYLLKSPNVQYRNPSRTVARGSKIRACGSGIFYRAYFHDPRALPPLWAIKGWGDQDWEDDWWRAHPPKTRSVHCSPLFFINRQVYSEAASFFYRTNVFCLSVGIDPHVECRDFGWDLVDDLTSIKYENLKLIRRMHLKIRIFDSAGFPSTVFPNGLDHTVPHIDDRDWWWPPEYSRSSYLAVNRRLKAFADLIRPGHGLDCLKIFYYGWIIGRPLDRGCYQTVLEPLANIFGVRKVECSGVEPDFGTKIARAMQADFLAVEEVPEAYGTRIVKRKGKTVEERYKLMAYYDSRYRFLLEDEDSSSSGSGNECRRIKKTLR